MAKKKSEGTPDGGISRRDALRIGGAVAAAGLGGAAATYLARRSPSDPEKRVLAELRQDGMLPEKFFEGRGAQDGYYFYYDYAAGSDGKPRYEPGYGLIASAHETGVSPSGMTKALHSTIKGKMPEALQSKDVVNELLKPSSPYNAGDNITIIKMDEPRVRVDQSYFDLSGQPITDAQAAELRKQLRKEEDEMNQSSSIRTHRMVPRYYVLQSASGVRQTVKASDAFLYSADAERKPLVLEFTPSSVHLAFHKLIPLNKKIVFDVQAVDLLDEFKPENAKYHDRIKDEVILFADKLKYAPADGMIRDLLSWKKYNEHPQAEEIEFRVSRRQASTLGAARFAAWVEANILNPPTSASRRFPSVRDEEVSRTYDYAVSLEGRGTFTIPKQTSIGENMERLMDWMEKQADQSGWQKQAIRDMRAQVREGKDFAAIALQEQGRTRSP